MADLPMVPDAELEYDSDLVFTKNGEPFTGTAFEGSPTLGRSEVAYCEGRQEGTARDWYPSGGLKSEATYRSNVQHGRAAEYDEAGRLVRDAWYEYGILARSATYDENANVIEAFNLDMDGTTGRRLSRMRRGHGWA